MVRVFIDASVWFAASLSPTGASALTLELAKRQRIHVVASRLILREAERNLRAKGVRHDVQRLHRWLAVVRLQIVPTPPDHVLARYEADIHPKDVPVLAAALEADVDYLVTLDRRHFFTSAVRARAGRVKVLTPGDLLKDLIRR